MPLLRYLTGYSRYPLCAFFFVSLAAAAIAEDTRPNIVLVLNDDVSAIEYDFLTDNNLASRSGAKTPTLDMMREKGVSFQTAWSMPICGPTRGSLVTGLYGQITGWRSNDKPPASLGDKFGTFGQLAQRAGYKVMIAGKWQMSGEPRTYGYDEFCLWQADDDPDKPLDYFKGQFEARGGDISPGYGPQSNQGSRFWRPFIVKNGQLLNTTNNDFGPDVIFQCAKDFISRQTRLGNKFLVFIPALLAHTDYDFTIDDGKFNHYVPVPTRDRKTRQIVGREPGPGSVKRNIEYQDYLMKRLLARIDFVNQTSNTVTMFMGDNGTQGYGKKQLPSERSTRVPFVVYGPGRIQPRGDSDQLVSTNDVYATLKGLMRVRWMPDLERPQSVDLSPYLLGAANEVERKWLYGLLEKNHWVRSRSRIYDGNQDMWKCASRDERTCRIIEVGNYSQFDMKTLASFQKIICLLERQANPDPSKVRQNMPCA